MTLQTNFHVAPEENGWSQKKVKFDLSHSATILALNLIQWGYIFFAMLHPHRCFHAISYSIGNIGGASVTSLYLPVSYLLSGWLCWLYFIPSIAPPIKLTKRVNVLGLSGIWNCHYISSKVVRWVSLQHTFSHFCFPCLTGRISPFIPNITKVTLISYYSQFFSALTNQNF